MKSYLEIAIKAAIDGGKAIMEVYATNFDIEIKGDNSPLTLADQKANKIINEYLLQTEIPIIAKKINKPIFLCVKTGKPVGSWILWMEPKSLLNAMGSLR